MILIIFCAFVKWPMARENNADNAGARACTLHTAHIYAAKSGEIWSVQNLCQTTGVHNDMVRM